MAAGGKDGRLRPMASSHAGNLAIVRSGHFAIFQSLNDSIAKSLNSSLIRNHPQNFGEISIAHHRAVAKFPFHFGVFRRQDVTQFRVSPLHFSCARLLEALGSALVGFQFWHKNLKQTISG
jgi:hypothetical protein